MLGVAQRIGGKYGRALEWRQKTSKTGERAPYDRSVKSDPGALRQSTSQPFDLNTVDTYQTEIAEGRGREVASPLMRLSGERITGPTCLAVPPQMVPTPYSRGTMFRVIDTRTCATVGTYKSRKRATAKADALDCEYGAVRYVVVYADSGAFASRFGR